MRKPKTSNRVASPPWARRVLDAHPSTQPQANVVVHTDGQPLRYPDGRKIEFAADSIALSSDDAYLFWKVLTGATLYRIPTAALRGEGLAGNDVSAFVQPYGKVGPTDGFWIARGTEILFIASIEDKAIRARDLRHVPAGGPHTVLQYARLRWPDTFSQAPDGSL